MDKPSDVSSSDYCIEHRALPILKAADNHKFELDSTVLEKVLLQEHVKDKNIVVVSIAGAFRKGKSFMLDFFLRYLRSKYVVRDVSDDWLGAPDAPLEGFSWRCGPERETSGILLWSEVFIAELPSKGEVAVLLMDTQGTFDSESTVRECATVFALSTMVSSIQVYNLSQNIQEDDLQHLQLFTEYGRLVLADSGEKPFQKLCFLIRDWCYPYDADYGVAGGQKILDRRLKLSDKQHPELKSVREHIYSCFSDISCFLMPHPGLKVATNPHFNGRLSDIEKDFVEALKLLAPNLLAPQNLILKEINGHRVKAKELLYYFRSYMNVYSGDELPEPKSMLAATAEANNLSAMAAAKDAYSSLMETVCGGTKPYLCSDVMERQHKLFKSRALEMFSKKKKMGGEEFSDVYLNKLDKEIEDLHDRFKNHNESKNLFKFTRTPAVCFCVIVFLYAISGLFGLLGLYYLANLANFLMGIMIATVIFWSYIRYSGEFSNFGECIDNAALFAWSDVMKPTFQNSVELLKKHSFSQIK